MFISEDLNFDMSWFLHKFLDDHMFIGETFHRLTFSCLELSEEFSLIAHKTHAFATATEGSFEHDWESYFFRFR